MLIKNPYRYCPSFTARVICTDGKVYVRRGIAESDMLYFPDEEGDILAIAMVLLDAGNYPVAETMWVDNEWQDYDEELLNQLEYGKPEPVVKEEPEEIEQEVEEDIEEFEQEVEAFLPFQSENEDDAKMDEDV